jgi:hypothetical protein
MQVFDLMLLDSSYYNYNQRHLVACTIYLVLANAYGLFNTKEVCLNYVRSRDHSLLISFFENDMTEFSVMMKHFIFSVFGFGFDELEIPLKYVAQFFGYEVC